MYRVGVSCNSGWYYTDFKNEHKAREFIKMNRDSHMEVYLNDKLIYEIHTLLPLRLIDHIDLSGSLKGVFQ